MSSQKTQQILKFIGELLAGEQFQSAQAQFFQQNCHHFENEDENKHQYKDLFNEYTSIFEQTVDAQLEAKFTEEEIGTFFEDFESNYQNYENSTSIVDTLFTITDFDKFKKSMLDYNLRLQGKVQDNNQKDTIESIPVNENVDFHMFDKYKNIDKSKWNLSFKGDDMELYTMPYEKTGLVLVRSEYTYKNMTRKAVMDAGLNFDFNKMTEKYDYVSEGKLLKDISDFDKIIYIRTKMPLMGDRDYVFQNAIKIIDDKDYIYYNGSINYPDCPEKKGCIRGDIQKIYWGTVSGNDMKFTTIEYANIKGYVPKMFMNMMMVKTAKQNIKQFENECRESLKKLSK